MSFIQTLTLRIENSNLSLIDMQKQLDILADLLDEVYFNDRALNTICVTFSGIVRAL